MPALVATRPGLAHPVLPRPLEPILSCILRSDLPSDNCKRSLIECDAYNICTRSTSAGRGDCLCVGCKRGGHHCGLMMSNSVSEFVHANLLFITLICGPSSSPNLSPFCGPLTPSRTVVLVVFGVVLLTPMLLLRLALWDKCRGQTIDLWSVPGVGERK